MNGVHLQYLYDQFFISLGTWSVSYDNNIGNLVKEIMIPLVLCQDCCNPMGLHQYCNFPFPVHRWLKLKTTLDYKQLLIIEIQDVDLVVVNATVYKERDSDAWSVEVYQQ